MSESQITIPTEKKLAALVYFVRGEKIFLDADLAMLYGVETGALNRAVKRNPDRFPADFMFQLDAQEWENLQCQIGMSSSHGGRRAAAYAFTEQGVAMLLLSLMQSSNSLPMKADVKASRPLAFYNEGAAGSTSTQP
ncbi:ORF6N domain-containing protein [Limnohabitans sp. Rim8]|uniref:ORF6N domain-containing protein n=1 Tax=Limnohabitans sp. Rim8 TaxID=1100718 RepID=UPI000D3ABEDE|nr:ORF6N domain-containing protein [Limnohabitans sp. Rim8]